MAKRERPFNIEQDLLVDLVKQNMYVTLDIISVLSEYEKS